MAEKGTRSLPKVAEDEIEISDDDSSDSEESYVEVHVVRGPVPPPVDGEVAVDELDGNQLTDEQQTPLGCHWLYISSFLVANKTRQ